MDPDARRAEALLCAPPMGGPTRPTPGVPFVSRRKEPKACQGLRPLEPPEGDASLPLRFPHPLDRVSATYPARFATLSGWAKQSLFLPKLYRGSHFLLSIRGAAGSCVACVLPGVAPLSGGNGEAVGGMIMPPKGGPGVPPWRIFGDFLFGHLVKSSATANWKRFQRGSSS